MATELNIKDGPTKPDLELGLYPERHLKLSFATDGEPFVVLLDKMREIPDGTEFELKGHVMSEPHKKTKPSRLSTTLRRVQARSKWTRSPKAATVRRGSNPGGISTDCHNR
jgi:hypothetical protein